MDTNRLSRRAFVGGLCAGACCLGPSAAEAAEYGLLLALIAVVCLAAITVLGTKISSMFANLATSI
jgi:pilus assembly protein Flp/PilA